MFWDCLEVVLGLFGGRFGPPGLDFVSFWASLAGDFGTFWVPDFTKIILRSLRGSQTIQN